jgi:hypothetical protein
MTIAIASVDEDMLQCVWNESDYRIDNVQTVLKTLQL